MLIKALSDYYDILEAAGKVLPDGYSNVKVHYLVYLTTDGKIDEISKYQKKEMTAKGKERDVPRTVVMPQRTEKPGIDANIIEHRPLYLFGLNYGEVELSPEDRTGKAKKSHELLVKTNLEFLEGLDSPVINAYRCFLQNWNPEEEKQNPWLLKLGKDYDKSGFVFCLTGYPAKMLQDDPLVKERWEEKRLEEGAEESVISQCAISGEMQPIARIHNKIKGVYGGLATGSVLIGFNNASEGSYGNDQAYNSNISEAVMGKYTEALNYLLGDASHKTMLDDVTVVFWAMNPDETYEKQIMAMLYGQPEGMDAEQTEAMLIQLMKDARTGEITWDRLNGQDLIQPDVDFYMVGLKPNSSRLAVKFIFRRRYAEVLYNIARYQNDMQVSEEPRAVWLSRIKGELVSPKSSSDKVNPALFGKLLEAIFYGTPYPTSLLETVIRRVKTDTDIKINAVRAGIIKACLNRNYKKEEIKVGLNKDNDSPAYVCGRLFAVLERLQKDAASSTLNRTIKDAYFAAAASKPGTVFPQIMMRAQNHLGKTKSASFFNGQISELVGKLNDRFPSVFTLPEQGEFIIGYYHQYQSYFDNKKENVKGMETEEKKDGDQ